MARLIPLLAGLVALMTVFGPVTTVAQDAPGELAEVLVTGEQPGPGMWRVSRDGHQLWVLGVLDPLPKRMSWHSRQADAAIANSQEVLAPPEIGLHIGFFKGLSAVPTVLQARKNAAGQTLRDVLPADLYSRWVPLRDKYLGGSTAVEKLRPMLAARELYRHAIDRVGLTTDRSVWSLVKESAWRHRVPITSVTLEVEVADPKGTLRQFEQIPRDPDVACLDKTIERLETDLEAMRQRANLWARGDVDGLRTRPYPDQRATCFDAVASVPALRIQLVDSRERMRDLWMAAAERAIARNPNTFAVLPISDLMAADGWLGQLRSRGYRVDEP